MALNTMDKLARAQVRLRQRTERYQRARLPLNLAFLARQISHDEFMRRSQRLHARFQREINRIHL